MTAVIPRELARTDETTAQRCELLVADDGHPPRRCGNPAVWVVYVAAQCGHEARRATLMCHPCWRDVFEYGASWLGCNVWECEIGALVDHTERLRPP